jgi:exodeoxyribonuclease VII large subunit
MAIARAYCYFPGRGKNMEVFNKPSLAEEALKLKCPFLTAIGHKQDTPLLQKVADKYFITPTELGQYFNGIYNQTVEELQNSKAKLIDDLSKQIDASYQIQIKSLNEQLEGSKALNEQQLRVAQEQIDDYKIQLSKKKSMTLVMWLVVVVACALGVLIGRGCNF